MDVRLSFKIPNQKDTSDVEIRRTIGHFLWMSDKKVRVPDKISDKKYKNIHLVAEKKGNISDHKGQQLGLM